jgi:arylsulfatase A-like enzyme
MSALNGPNILYIMADDHAAHAISAYRHHLLHTPHIDRLAREGARLEHCYCTNSICTPSRATILTGQYSHRNGVYTLRDTLDNQTPHLLPKLLKEGGYQTAMIGKWHLGHGPGADPSGFDHWCVLPGQGDYHDPTMIEMGEEKTFPGYVTNRITDKSLEWLETRDPDKPFFLMCHHKAPHRPWDPDAAHQQRFADEALPEPETLHTDREGRAEPLRQVKLTMEHLTERDLKQPVPEGLSPRAERAWRYQRYIKDYLRCCAAIDDNVGRLLDWLDAEGLVEDTLVIYTSDQGFFLGEHDLFDKRFMDDPSLRMPFLARYPREIPAGHTSEAMAINPDFAPTLLDYAGLAVPDAMQGRSARPILRGDTPGDWRQSVYYRYWMHERQWGTCAHYGVRTHRHKLIHYYAEPLGKAGATEAPRLEPAWELFDLARDPLETTNRAADPAYAETAAALTEELERLQAEYGDTPRHAGPPPAAT